MVGHAVSRTHRLHVAAIAAVEADDFLTVPVRELDQIQHPNRPEHRKVLLPNRTAQSVDAGAECVARDVGLGTYTALALIVAGALVPADINIVTLAFAVAAVGMSRADRESGCFTVGNLELELAALGSPLEPELGNFDHHAAGARFLDHAAPRQAVIERTVSAFTAQRRGRVCKERCIIRAGQSRFAGLVPDNAINADVGKLKGIVLVCCSSYCFGGGLVVLCGSDTPCSKDRRIQLYSPRFSITGNCSSHGTVAAGGRQCASHGGGQGQHTKMHSGGVGFAVFRDFHFCRIALGVSLCGLHRVSAAPFDTHGSAAAAVRCRGICLSGRQSCRDHRVRGSGYIQRGRKVRQRQRVLSAHDIDRDGVVRGQTGQRGRDRPKAHAGQSHGVAAAAVCRAGDGALAVGDGQRAASGRGDGELRQGAAEHLVQRLLKIRCSRFVGVLEGDVFGRSILVEHFADELLGGLLVHNLTAVLQLLDGCGQGGGDYVNMGVRVFVVFLDKFGNSLDGRNGVFVDDGLYPVNVADRRNKVNGRHLADRGRRRVNPLRLVLKHKVGERNLADVRVLGVQYDVGAVKARLHVRAAHLYRDLTLAVYRVRDARNRDVHDVIRRACHGLGGTPVRDSALADRSPGIFQSTAASQHLCDKGDARRRAIIPILKFCHRSTSYSILFVVKWV